MALSSTSLAVTVAHAVTYLTRPLATAIPVPALAKLQATLEANLAAAYLATWMPSDPARGSGRRILSFSPDALPPRPVYNACASAGVDWTQWSRLLGGYEFDLLVDPGSVSVRVVGGAWGAGFPVRTIVVWSDRAPAEASRVLQPIAAPARREAKTPAQLLIEADKDDDDALFSMLAAEMSAPTWCTPVIDQFPPDVLPVGAERLPRAAAGHSRSSSRSSVASSSAFSFLSDESMSSCASLSSVSTASASTTASSAAAAAAAASKRSRTERLRPARVFVDTTKTEVTPYDGGKTTVLTGGVMLGAAPAKNSHAAASGRSKTRRF